MEYLAHALTLQLYTLILAYGIDTVRLIFGIYFFIQLL